MRGSWKDLADPNILYGSVVDVCVEQQRFDHCPCGPRSQLPLLMQLFKAVAARFLVPVVVSILWGSQSYWQPFYKGSRDWGLRVWFIHHWGSSEAPQYIKSLDVVGLSWLERLCSIASGLAHQDDCPSIQKRGPQGVFHWLITLPPPWESLFQGTGEENLTDN